VGAPQQRHHPSVRIWLWRPSGGRLAELNLRNRVPSFDDRAFHVRVASRHAWHGLQHRPEPVERHFQPYAAWWTSRRVYTGTGRVLRRLALPRRRTRGPGLLGASFDERLSRISNHSQRSRLQFRQSDVPTRRASAAKHSHPPPSCGP
jgi:hypothetical protein